MLRILHTAETYSPEVNGVAEVVKQISTRLARRGHEVHVATRIVVGEKTPGRKSSAESTSTVSRSMGMP